MTQTAITFNQFNPGTPTTLVDYKYTSGDGGMLNTTSSLSVRPILSSANGSDDTPGHVWIPNYWYQVMESKIILFNHDWGKWIRLIVLPICVLFGLIGNILSIFVMNSAKMRLTSYSIFLAVLAFYDSMALVVRSISYINLVSKLYGKDTPITFTTDLECIFCELLTTVVHICSGWLVVLVTLERFIIVCFPLTGRNFCTRNAAKVQIILITVMAFCAQSYHIWETKYIEGTGCAMTQEAQHVHYYVATFFVIAVPLFLIFLFNMTIVCLLFRPKVRRVSGKDHHIKRVTNMLVTLSFTVFGLCFPNTLLANIIYFRPSYYHASQSYLNIFDLLWTVNFSVNFVVYVLSGYEVRREFYRMIGCRRAMMFGTSDSGSGSQRENSSANVTASNNHSGPHSRTAATQSVRENNSSNHIRCTTCFRHFRTTSKSSRVYEVQNAVFNESSFSSGEKLAKFERGANTKFSENDFRY
ncbi:growth hormone secretagogue receptor type 1-like [Lineus longissimus]|uniref:growth hormone secretagogue receptor type 1-like n=1 Tax=Lineus longissimus TaxID=88925 RepID=UPI00315C7C0B